VATRKQTPMPLDTLRRKQASQANEIAQLKAGVLELQQRMQKVEVTIGKVGSGELPPNVERETGEGETRSDADVQEEEPRE
jgi:hypothetical protein